MFTKTAVVTIACSAFLSFQVAAGAAPGKGPGRGDRDEMSSRVLERMSRKLDLTEDQKIKVAAILATTGEDLKGKAGNAKDVLQKTREEISAVLDDDQKKIIEEMKGQMRDGAAGFMQAHGPEMKERMQSAGEEIRLRTALASLDLTQEQKEKLRAVQQDLMEKRRALQEEIRPKMEALQQEAKDKVTAALNDEQKEQLQKKLKEMPKPDDVGRERLRGEAMDRMKERRTEGMRPGPDRRGPGPGAAGGDALLMELFR